MTRSRIVLLEPVLPIVLLVLWWVLSSGSTSTFYPPLEDIVTRFKDTYLFDRFAEDVVPSVVRMTAGLGIAAVLGIALGVLIGLSPATRRALSPTLEFLRAVPIVAMVPAALVLFGVGSKLEITLIAFACLWPILLNAVDGVRGVDPVALATARIYGLSPAQRIRTVVLPAMMPQVFAGLRVAIAAATALMVVANMFGSTSGLGYQVINAQQSFDVTASWAGIFMIGLVGLVANLIFVACQSRFLAWHRGWRASSRKAT